MSVMTSITAMAKSSRRTGRAIVVRLCREFPDWHLNQTNGGHLRFTSPAGAIVFMSSTPSDHRQYLNTRARLRRAVRLQDSKGADDGA
jgi:hypothetical protein